MQDMVWKHPMGREPPLPAHAPAAYAPQLRTSLARLQLSPVLRFVVL
jgi:hypothetical protein